MKTRMALAAVVTSLLILGGWSTIGQAPRRVEALMVRKLRSSQAVLEGLVTARPPAATKREGEVPAGGRGSRRAR